MNRTEYMEKLNASLADFSDEIKEEIVSDYEEHFRMGALNGKSEEQICEELGSIDELVAELRKLQDTKDSDFASDNTADADYESTAKAEKDKLEEFARSFAGALGAFGASVYRGTESLMGKVANGTENFAKDFSKKAGDCSEKFSAKAEKTADKVSSGAESFANSFVESFTNGAQNVINGATSFAKDVADSFENSMKEAKGEDWKGFNFRKQAEGEAQASESDSFTAEEAPAENVDTAVDTVVIEAGCADVSVYGSRNGNINFNYENHGSASQQMAYRFYHRQEGSTIYAGVKKTGTETGFFRKMVSPEIELTCELPEGIRKLIVKTASGDVCYRDVAVGEIKLESLSGDIDISNAKATELSIHTASGDVHALGGKLSSIRVYTASGDVDLNSMDSEGLIVDTASGDISSSGSIRKLSFKSASGDINVIADKTSEIAASSISGDVEVIFTDCRNGYTANVKTVSGDVNLAYGSENISTDKGGNYVLGAGECRLNISSVSGDVDVRA